MQILSQVTVSKSVVLRAIKATKGAISVQDAQVLLRHYLMSGRKESSILSFLATDTNLAAYGDCKAMSISSDFSIVVPGVLLVKTIEKMPETTDIVLSLNDLNQLKVSSGQFEAELQCLSSDGFPIPPDFPSLDKSVVDRALFLSFLKRISFSINQNPIKKNLLAVHFSNGHIQASDGKVTTMCKCSLSGKLNEITIPAMATDDLITALDASETGQVDVSQSDNFLVFDIGENKFLVRKADGVKFPDVFSLIDKPTKSAKWRALFDKTNFKEAIDRVGVYSDEMSLMVSIEFSSHGIRLFSKSAAGHKAQEQIDGGWSGPENFVLSFNYSYLIDIMNSIAASPVTLLVPSEQNLPVRFEDGDFIVFLVKLIL